MSFKRQASIRWIFIYICSKAKDEEEEEEEALSCYNN